VDDEDVAVGVQVHDGRVGAQVGQPLIGDQPELVVADQGVVLDEHVGAAARVVREPRHRQLLGAGVAPDVRPGLEDEDLQTGPGEVGRAHQGVVPGPDDHHLGLRRQVLAGGSGGCPARGR
jgi:hypothetical protein